jgi:predicted enzyme related to lactoylglutathione lyase
MIGGLRTAAYRVGDLAAAKRFYSRAFGVQPYFDEPFYVGFNVGGFELGLVPDGPGPGRGGVVAYWAVDDVAAAVARFVDAGATVEEQPHDVGGDIVTATVLDPFGNPIGLIKNPHFKREDVK